MTTPRTRLVVSLAAALGLLVTLGGCAGRLFPGAPSEDALVAGTPAVVAFDNLASDYVHVYLVGEQREWLLGRVEPGAHAMLRMPAVALADDQGRLRLAVLTGARVTMRAATDARATLTLVQPAQAILSQRWTFTQSLANGQLSAVRRGAAEAAR